MPTLSALIKNSSPCLFVTHSKFKSPRSGFIAKFNKFWRASHFRLIRHSGGVFAISFVIILVIFLSPQPFSQSRTYFSCMIRIRDTWHTKDILLEFIEPTLPYQTSLWKNRLKSPTASFRSFSGGGQCLYK